VATILRQFNPGLVGASVGSHLVELCQDPICPPLQYHPQSDVLNAAQSGAMVDDLLNHELDYLINQLKQDRKVDMKNDWKMLTIEIGPNDLCSACSGNQSFTVADKFEKDLRDTIEKLRANVPRLLINLMEMFNLSGVYLAGLKNTFCKDIHRVLSLECDCIFSAKANKTRQEIDELCQQFNQRMGKIANDYNGKNYSDFAVVTQPFGRNTRVEDMPLAFLSTLDCFHPSRFAHEAMAIGLWNNLVSPKAQKKTSMDPSDSPICPSATTLFYVD